MSTSQTSHQSLRGHITIHGTDSLHFLQNLITNDMSLLTMHPYLHACLLTPQGKFLHDFFITCEDDIYSLNCESAARAQDLFAKLNLYKLRSNVTITLHEDRPSYLTLYGYSFDDAQSALSLHDWEMARLSQARADGSRDADIGTSTLSELNLESATVSFDKGCYVGQELTARVHHRGLTKKRLYAVEFATTPPAFGTELPHKIGIMRSSYHNYGLALIKDEITATLVSSDLGFLQIP